MIFSVFSEIEHCFCVNIFVVINCWEQPSLTWIAPEITFFGNYTLRLPQMASMVPTFLRLKFDCPWYNFSSAITVVYTVRTQAFTFGSRLTRYKVTDKSDRRVIAGSVHQSLMIIDFLLLGLYTSCRTLVPFACIALYSSTIGSLLTTHPYSETLTQSWVRPSGVTW